MAYNSVLAYVTYDGVRQTALDEYRSLYVGASYTPSEHLPDYDSANYELEKIEVYAASLGGKIDKTSGSFVVPSDYCDICYSFVTKAQDGYNDVDVYLDFGEGKQYYDTVSLYVGASYTPSQHIPDYDASRYRLTQILVYCVSTGTVDVTTGSFVVNSAYTDITYYFESIGIQIWIDNGAGWDQYDAYIDNGTTWEKYNPYIDNGSTWES